MDALEPTAAPTGAPEAGGLTWIAPTSFSRQTPASSMRAAEYVFRGSDDAATLTVFFFGAGQGGSVQANLDRWIGQFLQPDGTSSTDAAQTTRLEMNGLRASIVDLSGTFVGGGMMPGAPTTSQPGQRMLAAIVEGPGGPVFFKLVGSEALIAEALAPFRTLVDSVRPST